MNYLKNINMADLGFEETCSIYINQSLCSYYKMLWPWNKKLYIMGRIYSWFVSGGTIKVKILEHGDFVSLTRTDDFIKHFPDVDFTSIISLLFLLSWVFVVLFIVSINVHVQDSFYLRFLVNILGNLWDFDTPIFSFFLFSRHFDKLGSLFAIKKFVYVIVSWELSFVNFSGQLWLSNFIYQSK